VGKGGDSLKHVRSGSLGRTMILAAVLVVFAFAGTIAAVTINVPKTDTLDQTLNVEIVQPLGDPIDGGPPGRGCSIPRGGD